jgi:hypothetical protein
MGRAQRNPSPLAEVGESISRGDDGFASLNPPYEGSVHTAIPLQLSLCRASAGG